MTYAVSLADLESITDAEAAFSTERLLPEWKVVPQDFRDGNLYTKLAEAIFFGTTLPAGDIELKPGVTPEKLSKAVRAHLQSFGPKHEHKIAGVGYLIAQFATLQGQE